MEKYGFIYIWRDRKHKRYYVGCHWGNEDDGYVCSSVWMKNSYNRRKNDFKRRIVKKIYTNKKDMFLEEQRYLDMIKDDEIKVRYYNLNKTWSHWLSDENKNLSVREKISKNVKKALEPEEIRLKMSLAKKGKEGFFKGKKHTEDTKKLFSEQRKGKIGPNKGKKFSEDHRRNLSESLKGNKPWNYGLKGKGICKAWNKGKENMIAKENFKKKRICPYCNFEGSGIVIFRWHFNNCKLKDA